MGTFPTQIIRKFGLIFVSLCLISKIPPSTSSALQPFDPNRIPSEETENSEKDFHYEPTEWVTTTTFRPTTTSSPTRPTTPGPETSTCGQVLDNSAGYISYSLTQPYEPNERCVWTIQVPGAQSYFFSVSHFSLTDKFDGVVISTVSRTTYDVDSLSNFHVWGTNPGILLTGQVAIVTFYSDEKPVTPDSRGFRLYYEAIVPSPTFQGPGSAFIISATSHNLEYPAEGEKYKNNELTTFIFTPNFKYSYSPGITYKHANYSKEGLDPICACCDRLDYYTFSFTDSTNGIKEWTLFEEICSTSYLQVETKSSEMILLVFQSDGSDYGKGFNLRFGETPIWR